MKKVKHHYSTHVKSRNKDLVEYFIEHGTDINKENQDGETPLFVACKSRNKDLAVYLVEHGADVNKRDENGDTPLFYANESGHINLIRYIKKI